MADLNDKKEEGQEEESFVRERILNRSEGRRQWVKRIVALLVSAVIFGVVACLVFAWMRPHAEAWFAEEESESPIYVPRDEETTAAETEPPSAAESTSEADIKDVVESAVESYQWTVSDYESLYRALNTISAQANLGVVTVTTRTQTADWFDNPIETVGRRSGIVWNITSYEMLILTSYQAEENETTVEVTFNNGEKAAASVKAADSHTGIAIVSVPLAGIDEVTKNRVTAAALGSSIDVKAGQPVILVGSPKDYVGSVAYGMVTYVRASLQREDMDVRMIYTDVSTDSRSSGFVLNLDGQIIGMITDETTGNNTGAIGISDLKSTIERLSNGSSLAYFGITGQDVTIDISEQNGIPRGIYVSEVTLEGPAYNGGIQSGDIITGIDDTEILSVKALQSYLEGKVPGDDVAVKVQRISREGYTEILIPVNLGTR